MTALQLPAEQLAIWGQLTIQDALDEQADAGPGADPVVKLCNDLLAQLARTCGADLNADGTEWCARRRGHAGACRPLPEGVRL